jgi:hypothetical protein
MRKKRKGMSIRPKKIMKGEEKIKTVELELPSRVLSNDLNKRSL